MVNISFRGKRPKIPATFKSWEVPHEGEDEKTFSRWANHDVIPVPPEQRNYRTPSFFAFWYVCLLPIPKRLRKQRSSSNQTYRVAAAVNASSWSQGSANIANGLTAGETCGMIAVAAILTGLISFICGEPGVRYHVSFPLMSRGQ
jgi:nucleobase:cation symporter-1, NCS1 family